MSDYIKREDAIKAVKHLSRNYTGRGKREDHPHIDFIIDEIKYEVPSADAEEVVRCKDCVHCEKETMLCTIFMSNRMPTDYCSEGERRDDESTNR